MQNEKNPTIAKQNLQLMVNDPLNGFYQSFTENIEKEVYDLINNQAKPFQAEIQEVEQLIAQKNNIQAEITKRKAADKIVARKVANGFILFFCFLLIGLPFLYYFRINRKIIKEFNNYSNDQNKIINELISKKNDYILFVMGHFNIFDLTKRLLANYNFELQETPNLNLLDEVVFNLNPKHIFVGFASAMHVRFKSTDTLMYEYKTLHYEDVVTYGYLTIKNDDKTYTLTASHVEPTPRMNLHGQYTQITNFHPELTFYTHSENVKKRHKTIFTNTDFALAYQIGNSNNNIQYETALNEYFTPLAQENYLKWYKLKGAQKFRKQKQFISTSTNVPDAVNLLFNCPSFKQHKNTKSYLNFESNAGIDDNLTNVYHCILKIVKSYVDNFTFINLAPAIAQEWYVPNGGYKIGSNYIYDEYKAPHETILSYIPEKLFALDLIYFKNQCELLPFFGLLNQEKIKDVYILEYQLCTYNKLQLVDRVPVRYQLNTYYVDVPFVRYEEVSIPLFVIFAPVPKKIKTNIINTFWKPKQAKDTNQEVIQDQTEQENNFKFEEMSFYNDRFDDLYEIMNKYAIKDSDYKFLHDADGLFILINNQKSISDSLAIELANWVDNLLM